MGEVFAQRPRPKKPTRRPATTRKPFVPKRVVPVGPEPQEPTDFPPPILGPPSIYPDCPRECLCHPSYPNSLNCENRNLRVVPVIPFRTHYLYLQNNYISELTAEAFNNATDVFEKIPGLLYFYAQRNQLNEVPLGLPTSLEQLRLDRNRISKIPAGAFTKLENLTLLDLHYNQLSDKGVPKAVFNMTSLLELQLAHNQLTVVPLFNNHLEHLHLNHNNIESINGTEICPFSMTADLSDDRLVPRLSAVFSKQIMMNVFITDTCIHQEGQACCFMRLLLRLYVERVFSNYESSKPHQQRSSSSLANAFVRIRREMHTCVS
ncbi:hypothetical protein GOODEAATRI_009936 [Goodea atripinnis]|uniref:LRRNT domain-containing protein n=1 Tax=Goodea atripinnis TaxID=208336 RepID=A0ABV0P2X1_9TELE